MAPANDVSLCQAEARPNIDPPPPRTKLTSAGKRTLDGLAKPLELLRINIEVGVELLGIVGVFESLHQA